MELLTDVTPSIDTYYLFRRRICEYQERTGIDMYADGAYQSPDNRKFAKNHNAMQLKTGKMQGGCRWELIPHDEDGLTVREIDL